MRTLLIATLVFATCSAAAQENLFLKEPVKPLENKELGWNPSATVGVNVSISAANNVVGQTDGTSETYGLDLKTHYDYVNERSEWRNSASYTGATTKTSSQPRFVKTSDALKYESLYLYSLESAPRVGPYAKVSAEAPIFFGEDVRATPVTYSITRRDGSTETVSNDTLRLTVGFKPLTTKESVGAFYKAVEKPDVRVDLRAGIGAEQILADGQLAVTDDQESGVIEVIELRNLSQVGVELAVTAKGQINETTSWEASVETLTPFVTNKESTDDRDAFRLTNIDGVAKLTSNLTSWASLSYTYKSQLKPQLLDRAQQTHLMVLNITHNLL